MICDFYGRFGRKSRNCWHFNVCFGAKLDSQNSRLSVEFKPSKRMKKRRELDALVNGSKQPSGARVKNGRHELLRNESESSEVEEFSLTHNTAARKWVVYCCEGCPGIGLGSFSVNLYSDPSLPPDTTIRGAVHLAETSAVFIPYHCAIYGKTRLSFEYIGSVEKAGRGCGTAPMALVQISPAVPHQGPHTVPQCTKTTTYRRADASCGPAM